jgi:hypothetical protein
MIEDFTKRLRALPYADMVKVASTLHEILRRRSGVDINATALANALAELGASHVPDSIESQQENKILREMFRSKRTIAIKEFNGGFNIELSTLRGHVMHKDLKQGLIQMLDTLVAAQALKK